MLEILGLLGGGLMRLLPSLLSFFKEGRDLKHELVRLDKEVELEKARGANAVQERADMAQQAVDTRWADGLVEALKGQTASTGDKWLDRINVSVRPVLTYWWCIVLYTVHKAIMVYVGLLEKLPLKEMAPIVMTEFDRAVVGSIIGFWFVDRSLRNSNLK